MRSYGKTDVNYHDVQRIFSVQIHPLSLKLCTIVGTPENVPPTFSRVFQTQPSREFIASHCHRLGKRTILGNNHSFTARWLHGQLRKVAVSGPQKSHVAKARAGARQGQGHGLGQGHELPRTSTDLHGPPRASTGFHGPSRASTGLHGPPRPSEKLISTRKNDDEEIHKTRWLSQP